MSTSTTGAGAEANQKRGRSRSGEGEGAGAGSVELKRLDGTEKTDADTSPLTESLTFVNSKNLKTRPKIVGQVDRRHWHPFANDDRMI